ncbi:MAG: hypothetical protein ABIQ04_01450 [Candidatus Saccharimonadales bacterium]
MTDYEKSYGYSHEQDPLAHLDFDEPVEIIDEDGSHWLPIDLENERRVILEKFAEHVSSMQLICGEVDTNDTNEYQAYCHNLSDLIASDEARLKLVEGDWVQLKGLSYVVHVGGGHAIDPSAVIRGRYQGVTLFPYYVQSGADMVEELAAGLYFAVTDVSMISADGTMKIEYELEEGSPALLTLHGKDVQVYKLEPLDRDKGRSDPADSSGTNDIGYSEN